MQATTSQTVQGGELSDEPVELRSVQTTPTKRKRDDEGNNTDSENDAEQDYKRRKIAEEADKEFAQALEAAKAADAEEADKQLAQALEAAEAADAEEADKQLAQALEAAEAADAEDAESDDSDSESEESGTREDPTHSSALSNFERFHSLPSGSASIDQVQRSSAGIRGWANARF